MRYFSILLSIIFLNSSQAFAQKLTEFVAEDFSKHDLIFNEPVKRWDEALPLGNGMMGILVWGDGHPLKLSLDRADLWDTRAVEEWKSPDYNYETMRKWVREGRINDLHELYELPYRVNPGPTKIPAGRIQLNFGEGVHVRSSRLSLKQAIANVEMNDGTQVQIFQHATEPIGVIKIKAHDSYALRKRGQYD
jgi:alpha-L-fucosidase 2